MIPNFVREREQKGLGFDLYFAGSQSQETEKWMLKHGSCRLQSQLNDRKNIEKWCQHNKKGKLFIDSGAYTAYTLGKKLDVDEYIQYLNSITDKLTCFAQVDHIPGTNGEVEKAAELSWNNYLYMRKRVTEPDKLLPIFHQGEDCRWLENMLNYKDENGERIKYIGFGYLVGATSLERKQFFDYSFSIISKSSNPNIKVHAMGMTSLGLLETYPFYSADSTSWIMVGASGTIMTPWGNIDVSEKDKFAKTNLRNMKHGKVIIEWLEKNGLIVEELYTDYKKRMMCNLIYLTEWSKNYRFKGSMVSRKKLF